MKKCTVALSALAALFSTAMAQAADVQSPPVSVNGGAIHFKGEVVSSSCAVDAGSADQVVRLGQVRSVRLANENNISSPVGFNIQLDDCDATVASGAKVAFTGSEVSGKQNILALQSTGAGAATNVGIQILDSRSIPMQLDGTNFGAPISLTNGTNVIPFQVRYIATGAATPGTANADATFKVQYQ